MGVNDPACAAASKAFISSNSKDSATAAAAEAFIDATLTDSATEYDRVCAAAALAYMNSFADGNDENSVQNNVPQQSQAFSSGIKKLPDIYWNTTNPMFRIDNTDHVIDVNQGRKNTITEFDQVNILCPFYDKKTTPNINETERFVIYHVQKQEYDMCNLLSGNPKAIVICDKPYS